MIGDGAAPAAAPAPAPAAAARRSSRPRRPPPPPPATGAAASAAGHRLQRLPPPPRPRRPSEAAPPLRRAAAESVAGATLLSPIVRRLLAENGMTRADVTGPVWAGASPARTSSGPPRPDAVSRPGRGEPTRHPRRRTAARATAPPPAATRRARPAARCRVPTAAPVSMASFRSRGDQVVPFSNMRRRTAEHMVRSKATSPHAFIAKEVDFEAVERVRKAWGDASGPRRGSA